MRPALLRYVAVSALAAASTLLLTSCGTTRSVTASRPLPPYEPPMARADTQIVRTTAYTHTESDHLAYGARNAVGGILQSATIPQGEYRETRRALPVSDLRRLDDGLTFASFLSEKRRAQEKKARAAKPKKRLAKKTARARKPQPPRIGSAAADWSRWPLGTTFRVLSTGQIYKVDDYGWALAGRNTIDLYMASKADMNRWGVRHEPIQILRWGDREASLALLQSRQKYKHCRRMALALQDNHEAAAALR